MVTVASLALKTNILTKNINLYFLANASRQRATVINSCRFFRSVRLISTGSNDATDWDFGHYDIILPPDPPIWGVSHINPRTVPKHIIKPPYASIDWSAHDQDNWIEPHEGDGLIPLDSAEETHLRESAVLAKEVLSYAESLVEVRL